MPKPLMQIGTEPDPEKRRRQRWTENLVEQIDLREWTRKEFHRRLTDVGCHVSMQTVGMWLRAETAPRPIHQVAIASLFQVPVHRLFPVEAAAA